MFLDLNSVAFNNGFSLPLITDDFFLNARSSHPTIGAIESSALVSVSEIIDNSTVSVYPNPAREILNIELNDGVIDEIQFYNSLGALVYSQKHISNSNLSVNVARFNSGVYLLKVKTMEDVSRLKVILD